MTGRWELERYRRSGLGTRKQSKSSFCVNLDMIWLRSGFGFFVRKECVYKPDVYIIIPSPQVREQLSFGKLICMEPGTKMTLGCLLSFRLRKVRPLPSANRRCMYMYVPHIYAIRYMYMHILHTYM